MLELVRDGSMKCELRDGGEMMEEQGDIPRVALPPTLTTPNLAKGSEKVVIFGVMSRMTITEDGSEGCNCGMPAVSRCACGAFVGLSTLFVVL